MQATFSVDVASFGSVPATVYPASEPRGMTFLFAPGAGASRSHPFMVSMASLVAAEGIDVVTFDFLYAASGGKMPDPSAKLQATYSAMIGAVRARSPLDALFVGGKSMGGRIASLVVAAMSTPSSAIGGLVFLGYPLIPPSKKVLAPRAKAPRGSSRAVPERFQHLLGIGVPMLFVQGSRDPFGGERELRPLMSRLEPAGTLSIVHDADHSLGVPRGRGSQDDVYAHVAEEIGAFCTTVVAR